MAGYAQLTHISLTGVDDQTDLARRAGVFDRCNGKLRA